MPDAQDSRGLAMPNPCLYYSIWLRNFNISVRVTFISCADQPLPDSSVNILIYTTKMVNVPTGFEAAAFAKSNRLLPTYALIQKIWNKGKQLQWVTGFTLYSPIR